MPPSKVPQLCVRDRAVEYRWGELQARLPPGPMRIAHLGCKTLDTLHLPDHLKQRWTKEFGKGWSRPTDKTGRLAKALVATLAASGAGGLLLSDTMRHG